MDELCNPAGLVRGQGVHGIDKDCFDPGFSPVLVTIIQDGIEKTFGLTGACAGGNYGGSGVGPDNRLKAFSW